MAAMKESWWILFFRWICFIVSISHCLATQDHQPGQNINDVVDLPYSPSPNEGYIQKLTLKPGLKQETKFKAMRKVFEFLQSLPEMRKSKAKNARQGRFLTDTIMDTFLSALGGELAGDATEDEITNFITEMESLADLIEEADGNPESPLSAPSGGDAPETGAFSTLWDIISLASVRNTFSEFTASATDILGDNAYVEAMAPIVNSITSGNLARLLNPNNLSRFLRAEANEDEIDLMQMVTVLAARSYEFPPSCNTSRYYTERFRSGLCQRPADCYVLSGESLGSCGLGVGSCCVYHGSCGVISTEWISHFTEPEEAVAGPGTGECSFTVQPRHDNVCQYKIEFEDFKIAGPNKESMCDTDFIEFIGGTPVPKLCGDLTGQHLYVTVDRNEVLKMIVYTSGRKSDLRKWNTKITQINCGSLEMAPVGCLQFFNSTKGRVKSFNHVQRTPISAKVQYQIQANYGICVNPLPEHCAIIWEESGEYSFSMSGDASADSSRFRSLTGSDFCDQDYLIIPGAVYRDPITNELKEDSRFCGTRLPKLITNTMPYTLHVVSDRTELRDRANGGFDLSYRQIKC